MLVITFNLGFSTHDDTPPTRFIGIFHPLQTIDISTCRKIGGWNILHQTLNRYFGIVDIGATSIYHFSEIVSWHVGGHTHSNTITSIHEQIWNLCRHHSRFPQCVIEVVYHINGIFFDVIHNMLTHLCQTTLGVSHGSWRVSVNRAEVSLSVNKFVAHIPLLAHSHQSTINRGITMWMVFTQNLTNDAGTFLVWLIAKVTNTSHSKKNAAVYRLETVTNIWESTCNYHRH